MRRFVVRWLGLILGACLMAFVAAWGWSRFRPVQSTLHSETSASAAANVPPSSVLELAAPCTGTSRPEDLFKIFADTPPLKSSQYALNDLPRIFPAFQHKPFNSAGFNAVMLPFSYSDPNHLGNANEAMALSALVSNDLDWSPGCYCSRHAYFVFKRDREAVQGFMRGYDPSQIASFINDWQATHAIGGELIRTAAGYKGKLEIFDVQGAAIFTKQYDASRSYWGLLGDMDVDAMTFLDVKPSQGLIDYLHMPRCTQFQSVIDLGSAALMEEKSPEEFGVYQKIILADPGFSMVRHWYANQKHWNDGDDRFWTMQNGLALASRLEPGSLEEFHPANCPDPKLTAQLPQWLDHAEALVSHDAPMVIARRLENQCYGSQTLAQIIQRGLLTAAKYPNSHELLVDLGRGTSDKLMVASLFAASVLDLYMPGSGEKGNETYDLAWTCDQIGRDDVAMEFLSGLGTEQPKYQLDLLIQALSRGGRYTEAADFYPLVDQSGVDESTKESMAPYAAFAAVMTGRTQLLEQILRDQDQALAAQNLSDVFQDYDNYKKGKSVNINVPSGVVDAPAFWKLLMLAQHDAHRGTSTYHCMMMEALCQVPTDRLLWIGEDNYEQRDPSADAAAFYDYLGFLFSYDPWVNAAVADFHRRGGMEKTIDPEMLRADLRQGVRDGFFNKNYGDVDWKHVLTPWRVAACVHQLLEQHKTRDAAEIARLYEDYESNGQNIWQITIAGELMRRVAAAPLN
jgi:hypothetical protein